MGFPFWEHIHFREEVTFRDLLWPLKTSRHGVFPLGDFLGFDRSQMNESVHVANYCALRVGNLGIVWRHLATEIVPIHRLHFKEKFENLNLPFLDDSLPWRIQSIEQFIHHVSEEHHLHVSSDCRIQSARLQSDAAQTKY